MRGLNLKDNEDILDIVYQSMLVYVRSLVVAIAALVATSYFLFWLLEQGWWGQTVVGLGYGVGVLLVLRLLIFWRGTKLVVTTERVFDIYQSSLFKRDITQIRMRDIDEVTGEISGFWGTIFRLGQVRIQAKRGEVAVRLAHVRHPIYVQDIILDRMDELELGNVMEKMGEKEVLSYMESLDVQELDGLLRKAMGVLRAKKEG